MRLPKYTDEEIKRIEKEFDTEEGWIKADEVLGKDRVVKSIFIKQNIFELHKIRIERARRFYPFYRRLRREYRQLLEDAFQRYNRLVGELAYGRG